MTAPATDPRDALARRLRDVLARHPVVREVRMFGGLSFMVDERMAVAAGRGGDLLVPVRPDDYDDLLGRGAEPAYMGADRSMGRGWLSVPARVIEDDDALAYWVAVGIDSRDQRRRPEGHGGRSSGG